MPGRRPPLLVTEEAVKAMRPGSVVGRQRHPRHRHRRSTRSPARRSRWSASLDNTVLIIAGALVGASGTILTVLMAAAMNRSISAIIVPGYGLAAARAQHDVVELADLLSHHGVDVCYAIHPVAGRMPGHMNVLLAEAHVPYPQMKELAEVNPEFGQADVALVVGANDVPNPAARRPGNAISGMLILDVDQAKSVIVIKRSMGHGYAGMDNELFTDPKTGMLFNDAKAGLSALTAAMKTLVH